MKQAHAVLLAVIYGSSMYGSWGYQASAAPGSQRSSKEPNPGNDPLVWMVIEAEVMGPLNAFLPFLPDETAQRFNGPLAMGGQNCFIAFPDQRSLLICDRELRVREGQPDATALELATRAQVLSTLEEYTAVQQVSIVQQLSIEDRQKSLERQMEYGKKAAEFYAKVPGVSSASLAAKYRLLTRLALLSGRTEQAVQFNDLTNQYLAQDDAHPRNAMVPSNEVRKVHVDVEERHYERRMLTAERPPTEDQLLNDFLESERNLASLSMFRAPGYCAAFGSASLGSENTLLMKGNPDPDYKLAFTSANGSYFTSIIQSECGRPLLGKADGSRQADGGTAQLAATSADVPGYVLMVHWKGTFTETIAPRRSTVLPDVSPEQSEAIQAFTEMISKLSHGGRLTAAERKAIQDSQKPFPGPSTKRDPSTVKPLAFLEMLQPHEAFVDIYRYRVREGDHFGAHHYLAVISEGIASSRLIQLGPAEPIESAVHSFFTDVSEKGGSGSVEPGWKELERVVVRPILDVLPKDTQRIWLSPDSSFALVPFASLVLDMGSPISVSIVPSAYDFVRLHATTTTSPPKRALLVGDLDYGAGKGTLRQLDTAEELTGVQKEATGARLGTVTLSRAGATRSAVIDKIRDAQFLHFATHGFAIDSSANTAREAFRSARVALSFANSGSSESSLTGEDIVHLDLSNVQLVTLSACDSGTGRPTDGQGLLGFQTTFMAAGGRALLLSLWKVPDEATAMFMQLFYQGLWYAHLSKAEAMRQSQERVKTKFADPYNWGAWILLGEAW